MKSRTYCTTITHWCILQVDDSFLLHTTRTAYYLEPSSWIPINAFPPPLHVAHASSDVESDASRSIVSPCRSVMLVITFLPALVSLASSFIFAPPSIGHGASGKRSFNFVFTDEITSNAGMTLDQFLSLLPATASRERIISKLAGIRAVLDAWPQRSSDYHASMRVTLRQVCE